MLGSVVEKNLTQFVFGQETILQKKCYEAETRLFDRFGMKLCKVYNCICFYIMKVYSSFQFTL